MTRRASHPIARAHPPGLRGRSRTAAPEALAEPSAVLAPFGSRYIFPRQVGVTGFNDITPRMGAAYDLFGNGKTSVKVSISKYLESAQNGGLYTINNSAANFQQTTARSWTDGNHNFIPDCDLMNPAAQNN